MCDFAFCFLCHSDTFIVVVCCCLISLHKIENLCETGDWWIHETLFSGTRDTAFKTSTCPDQTLYSPCGRWRVCRTSQKETTHNFKRRIFPYFSFHRKRSTAPNANGVKFCSFQHFATRFCCCFWWNLAFQGPHSQRFVDIVWHLTTSYDIVRHRLWSAVCLEVFEASGRHIQKDRLAACWSKTPANPFSAWNTRKNQEDAMFFQDGIILNLLNHIHNLLHI